MLDGPAIPASGEATASAEQARDGALFDARPAEPPRGAPDAGFAVSASFDVEPDESAVEAVREVLAAGGAPVRLAAQALGALGPEAADQLRDDPWNLLALSGISPQQADLFAQTGLGRAADPDDPRRTRALIVWHLTRAAGEGHTAADAAAVASVLGGFGVQDGLGAVRAAYENGRVMAFAERPEPVDEVEGFDEGADLDDDFEEEAPDLDDPFSGPSERVLVALERHALAEEGVAEAVVRLMSTAEASDGPAWPASPLGEALRAAGVVLYVTGAGEDPPAAPLALTRTVDARVAVAAATLDGRGRLAGVGVEGAVTVHGLIVGAEGPARSPDGLLDVDLLVVAEAHLLGPQTVEALLEAVPDAARVLLCGDPDELEPAGPGRVFADLRDSGLVPVVGSRERGAGVLGSLTVAVRAGSLPPVDSPDRQVVLVGARSAAEAVHRCVQLVGDSIPRALGIPADDVLVVTPAGGGSAGTSALNTALKERLNPGPGKYGGFDIGDRVVRIPQGRDTGLLEGRVVEAVPDGLAVAYRDLPGDPVTVPRARLGELRHGWAVTVRQALGLRRPGIVAMLPGDAGALVTRALVYTAFTRAQRHLSIVYPAGGNLPQAVARTADGTRTTRLGAALREAARESGLILH
ncbi:MAG: AAA family ATPase [Streptomycetaceae bacterium]|nr:AAA family ATPase [Streptomycetaceae bacterium]